MNQGNLTELEAVHSELERLHDRCERGLVMTNEISPLLAMLDLRARSALPSDSDPFRLLDSQLRAQTDYWEHTMSGYLARKDAKNIGRRIAAIRLTMREIEPEFLRTEARAPWQLYFQAGEAYRARQEFYRLLRRASRRIDVADPYLDAIVFDYIEALDDRLTIRLVARDPKALFSRQLEAIRAAGRTVEARSNDQNHDRFVILDGQEVWHLGASINHLGSKASMMNRISERGELTRVVDDFEEWWRSGVVL